MGYKQKTFVDTTSNQNIAGEKTFSEKITINSLTDSGIDFLTEKGNGIDFTIYNDGNNLNFKPLTDASASYIFYDFNGNFITSINSAGLLQMPNGIIEADTLRAKNSVRVGDIVGFDYFYLNGVTSQTRLNYSNSDKAFSLLRSNNDFAGIKSSYSYLAPSTFANLPTTGLSNGTLAIINDASSVSYRGTASGGGSDIALVMYDGTNWIYH